MSVRENLIKAKALIESPDKWGRGEYVQNGCFCAIGALAETMKLDPVSSNLTMSKEYKALLDAVPDPRYGIWGFNDDPATKHADIMDLYQRAIEASK